MNWQTCYSLKKRLTKILENRLHRVRIHCFSCSCFNSALTLGIMDSQIFCFANHYNFKNAFWGPTQGCDLFIPSHRTVSKKHQQPKNPHQSTRVSSSQGRAICDLVSITHTYSTDVSAHGHTCLYVCKSIYAPSVMSSLFLTGKKFTDWYWFANFQVK